MLLIYLIINHLFHSKHPKNSARSSYYADYIIYKITNLIYRIADIENELSGVRSEVIKMSANLKSESSVRTRVEVELNQVNMSSKPDLCFN